MTDWLAAPFLEQEPFLRAVLERTLPTWEGLMCPYSKWQTLPVEQPLDLLFIPKKLHPTACLIIDYIITSLKVWQCWILKGNFTNFQLASYRSTLGTSLYTIYI